MNRKPRVELRAAAASRQGPSHRENEDRWRICAIPNGIGGLFMVCDGVSTSGAGAYAAQLATDRLEQFCDPKVTRQPGELIQLVSEIDWELRGNNRRAACTLALAWVESTVAYAFTLGDSPIFRLRDGRMRQAGTDRTGTFNKLQAYLGMGPAVSEQLVTERWELLPGDVIVLCSDGVLEAMHPDNIARIWSRTRDPEIALDLVLDEVARGGVDDDATMVLVEVSTPPPIPTATPLDVPEPPGRLSRSWY